MAFTALEFQRLLRREPDKDGKPVRLGAHGDGDGLYLVLGPGDAASWIFRYQRPSGRVSDLGLGTVKEKSLKAAREHVLQLQAQRGRCKAFDIEFDPIKDSKAERAAKKPAPKAPTMPTFEEIAELYLAENAPTWKNTKHPQQWRNTLATYVYPIIGAMPVDQITKADVVKIVQPLWLDKNETASRIRGRIEALLDFAIMREYRRNESNPARLRLLGLPKRKQVRKMHPVRHHPAMPFAEVPVFMADLATRDSISARALRFTILTAARTNEVLGATWSEINLKSAVWTLSAERMKAARDHRVPLSVPSIELLRELKAEESDGGEYVFGRDGEPMSENSMLKVLAIAGHSDVTVHGFRSSFRDWASEETDHPSEVVEMALAHAVADETEAAYRRGELLKKRRELMQAWANFCSGPRAGNVVTLHQAR